MNEDEEPMTPEEHRAIVNTAIIAAVWLAFSFLVGLAVLGFFSR